MRDAAAGRGTRARKAAAACCRSTRALTHAAHPPPPYNNPALHEDLERLERLIVKDYAQEVKSHKEKLMQKHRVRKRLDQMQDAARKLVSVLMTCVQAAARARSSAAYNQHTH